MQWSQSPILKTIWVIRDIPYSLILPTSVVMTAHTPRTHERRFRRRNSLLLKSISINFTCKTGSVISSNHVNTVFDKHQFSATLSRFDSADAPCISATKIGAKSIPVCDVQFPPNSSFNFLFVYSKIIFYPEMFHETE